MSSELIHKVDQVFIDEKGKYVIISIRIIYRKGGNKNKTPKINQRENYMNKGNNKITELRTIL